MELRLCSMVRASEDHRVLMCHIILISPDEIVKFLYVYNMHLARNVTPPPHTHTQ